MISAKDAVGKCICKMCPSYVKCDESIAFCLNEKSKCIKAEKGCLCPACPVQAQTGFMHVYYCTRGAETKQK